MQQDYQLQLMLLEQANKKRLMLARQEQDAMAREALARLEEEPILEEALTEEQQQDEQKQQEDNDALARTAHELLEKIEHNKTDKFQNSQFLGLMRKLRDREMKVEGDKMVETVRAIHTPDSTYGSGPPTPVSLEKRRRPSPPPEFDSHIEFDRGEEHEFDHWESPYR